MAEPREKSVGRESEMSFAGVSLLQHRVELEKARGKEVKGNGELIRAQDRQREGSGRKF